MESEELGFDPNCFSFLPLGESFNSFVFEAEIAVLLTVWDGWCP